MRHNISPIGRRDLLGVAITAFIVPVSWRPAGAQITDAASARMPIERLDGALLVAMKAGDRTSFTERYRALAPVVEQVFNLDAVLAASVGLSWATLPEAQKADLATGHSAATRFPATSRTSTVTTARASRSCRRCALSPPAKSWCRPGWCESMTRRWSSATSCGSAPRDGRWWTC